ncbi:DMT family transporter [Castellaniella sp. GW247-6E4]|uniref:DMT family transporter n=1 Tax=Castellaniella sp. GW247-6E4 TaxID=3140380 RepID=UPI0033153C3C
MSSPVGTPLPIDGRASGLMVVLCLVWGLQQVAIKAVATDIAPIMQIGLRSCVAVILVALLIRWRRERIDWAGGSWRPGILVGVLFAVEYLLVGEGLRYTTASHMSVFLYTAPIFAALGLQWRLPAERLSAIQWLGILVAFLGIVVTFYDRGPSTGGVSTDMLIGDLLGLLGGAAWGATTVVLRCTRLAHAPTTHTLLYQLIGAALILVAAAAISDQAAIRSTPLVVASMLYQTLLMAFGSLLVWFWLLRTYLASRLGVLSFMTPLFGVAFGVWLLDEPLDAGFVIGAILVMTGILMVSGHEWLRSHLRARPAG